MPDNTNNKKLKIIMNKQITGVYLRIVCIAKLKQSDLMVEFPSEELLKRA